MSKQVMTKIGLLPYAELEITDIVTEEDNARVVATEYKYKGEIVKRDAWACLLRPHVLFADTGKVG